MEAMNRKIRVLFDANPLVRQKTGVGFYTESLVSALAKIPELELAGCYFQPRGRDVKLAGNPNLQFKSAPWAVGILAKGLRKFGIRLPFEILFWCKGDILLFPDFTSWPSIFRTPKVLTIHDLTFVDHPSYVTKANLRFLRRYVKRDAQNAKLILTISEFTKNRLREVFGLASSKIIANPIPPAVPIKPKSSIKLPERYVLFVGTIEPRKNIKNLVKAYELLPDGLKQTCSLVIAGGYGWHSEQLQKDIQALQEQGLDIRLPGYVDDATRAALYTGALAVVAPSFYEGFGMPILEAFSYHTPAIVSDIPVFKEVAADAALYFDPDSPESIKNTLEDIISNKALGQKLVAKADARLKLFDWQKIAEDIARQFEKLV